MRAIEVIRIVVRPLAQRVRVRGLTGWSGLAGWGALRLLLCLAVRLIIGWLLLPSENCRSGASSSGPSRVSWLGNLYNRQPARVKTKRD